MFSLPWTPGKAKIKHRTLIRDDLIAEGTRNQTLFEWSCFMCQNKDGFIVARDTVVRTLAQYFCNPPLVNESEIENLIHVENRIENADSNVQDSSLLEPSSCVEYFFEKWGTSKFRYHNAEQDWFQYDEQQLCWKPITPVKFQSFMYNEFGNDPQSNSLRRTNFLNNFTQL